MGFRLGSNIMATSTKVNCNDFSHLVSLVAMWFRVGFAQYQSFKSSFRHFFSY